MQNTGSAHELVVHTVSSDSTAFFPLSFEVTTVAPGERTAIQVAYLPRATGEDHGTIVIHTSAGAFIVRLEGVGQQSPYSVAPLTGVTAPVGVHREYLLSMHNPFKETLWIKEVYTNEDFVRLALPAEKEVAARTVTIGRPPLSVADGQAAGAAPSPSVGAPNSAQNETAPNAWAIPPHTTRPVISLHFKGQSVGAYLGTLHIRLDRDSLLIPLELHAIEGSVYRAPDMVEFGVLTASNQREVRDVRVVNGGPLPLAITKVYATHPDQSLTLKSREGSVVPPFSEGVVATLTYVGLHQGKHSGSVTVRTNATTPSGARLEVPYSATVAHGGIQFHARGVTFRAVPGAAPVRRSIPLVNTFNTGLTVYSVVSQSDKVEILSEPDSLGARTADEPIAVRRFDALPNLDVRVHVGDTPARPFETVVHIFTNITRLSVPIRVYTGELEVLDASGRAPVDKLDFGVVATGPGLVHARELVLANPNPVSVMVGPVKMEGSKSLRASLGSPYQWKRIATIEGGEGDAPVLTPAHGGIALAPGEAAKVRVEARIAAVDEARGTLRTPTSHTPLRLPVSAQGMEGELLADPLSVAFGACYPGVAMSQQVWVTSTYPSDVRVVATHTDDKRLHVGLANPVLKPNVATHVADLVLDVGEGSPLSKTRSGDVVGTLVRETFAVAVTGAAGNMMTFAETAAFEALTAWWETSLGDGGGVNTTAVLQTDLAGNLSASLSASLAKPRLHRPDGDSDDGANVVDFGLVQRSTWASMMVDVYNPSALPMAAHLMPLGWTNPSEGKAGLLGEAIVSDMPFSVPPGATVEGIIPPLQTFAFGPVHFRPMEATGYEAVLHVKNNLTMLDEVLLRGSGGSGILRLEGLAGEGLPPRPELSLLDRRMPSCSIWGRCVSDEGLRAQSGRLDFELNGSHSGEGGDGGSSSSLWPPFGQAKMLTLTNDGDLPVYVHSVSQGSNTFAINETGVLGLLQPGQSAGVEVTFRPDCSARYSSAIMDVHTSIGPMRVSLEGSATDDLLNRCLSEAPLSLSELCLRASAMLTLVVLALMVAHVYAHELAPRLPTKATAVESQAAVPAGSQATACVTVSTSPRRADAKGSSVGTVSPRSVTERVSESDTTSRTSSAPTSRTTSSASSESGGASPPKSAPAPPATQAVAAAVSAKAESRGQAPLTDTTAGSRRERRRERERAEKARTVEQTVKPLPSQQQQQPASAPPAHAAAARPVPSASAATARAPPAVQPAVPQPQRQVDAPAMRRGAPIKAAAGTSLPSAKAAAACTRAQVPPTSLLPQAAQSTRPVLTPPSRWATATGGRPTASASVRPPPGYGFSSAPPAGAAAAPRNAQQAANAVPQAPLVQAQQRQGLGATPRQGGMHSSQHGNPQAVGAEAQARAQAPAGTQARVQADAIAQAQARARAEAKARADTQAAQAAQSTLAPTARPFTSSAASAGLSASVFSSLPGAAAAGASASQPLASSAAPLSAASSHLLQAHARSYAPHVPLAPSIATGGGPPLSAQHDRTPSFEIDLRRLMDRGLDESAPVGVGSAFNNTDPLDTFSPPVATEVADPPTSLGGLDALSSMGRGRLGEQGLLGGRLYDIWGDSGNGGAAGGGGGATWGGGAFAEPPSAAQDGWGDAFGFASGTNGGGGENAPAEGSPRHHLGGLFDKRDGAGPGGDF